MRDSNTHLPNSYIASETQLLTIILVKSILLENQANVTKLLTYKNKCLSECYVSPIMFVLFKHIIYLHIL